MYVFDSYTSPSNNSGYLNLAKQCIVRDTASCKKLGTEVHQDLEVIPEPVGPCAILKTRILCSHSPV